MHERSLGTLTVAYHGHYSYINWKVVTVGQRGRRAGEKEAKGLRQKEFKRLEKEKRLPLQVCGAGFVLLLCSAAAAG